MDTPSHRVRLVVEGSDLDGGNVRLDVFVRELERLRAALDRADHRIANGQSCTYFAIVGLSHNSPATVEIEARVRPNCPDERKRTFELISNAIIAVEKGEFSPDTDYELLADIRDLATPVGSTLKSAQLLLDDRSHSLTPAIAGRIRDVLSEHEECVTTIEGMLERINVHAEANLFTIYPSVGAKQINCKVPEWLVEKCIAAVRHRVAVTGLAKYRKFSVHPHEIVVHDLAIYPNYDGSHGFDALRGIAPYATGDMLSEDFVSEVRDGWQ